MAQEYELNLRDYWNILLKRKWIIILTFFVFFVSTVIYTNLQPLIYRAQATIKIDFANPASFTGINSQYFSEDHFAIISDYKHWVTSYELIKRAVGSGVLPKDASQRDIDNLVSSVVGKISAEDVKDTSLISLTLVSQDPQRAALILNKVTERLKFDNIKRKSRQIRNVREFIEAQLHRVSFQLKQSEDRLKTLTMQGVGGLANALLENINLLEAKRDDLLTKFTALHPDVKKANEQLVFLKDQLQHLPKSEFEFNTVKRDVAINERLYISLKEKLQDAQIRESDKIDNIFIVNPATTPQSPFSPNKPRNYLVGIIIGIVWGVFVGLIFEHLDASIGRIEDLEEITKLSVIGVIPYFFKRGKEPKGMSKIKKEERQHRSRALLMPMYEQKYSIFLESFRILGANVQVLFGNNERIKQKSILITSSNPEEGKSMISSNLSIILAQMGYKVVLIDTDIRRSSLHHIFGLKKEGGLTDILTGKMTIDQAIRTVTDLLLGDLGHEGILHNPWLDNFHLITVGTIFPNSPYLLNTENMNILIKDLKNRYDLIIMDSSPALSVSDISILIPKVDGALLVYRAGVTSRFALRRAKLQIESSAGKQRVLKGIILNSVTPESGADTYYYYSQKYAEADVKTS